MRRLRLLISRGGGSSSSTQRNLFFFFGILTDERRRRWRGCNVKAYISSSNPGNFIMRSTRRRCKVPFLKRENRQPDVLKCSRCSGVGNNVFLLSGTEKLRFCLKKKPAVDFFGRCKVLFSCTRVTPLWRALHEISTWTRCATKWANKRPHRLNVPPAETKSS